ncbi:tetratricopeptide repeat protein [Pajaroellobacter abortibovis]|uniref:tetratricopeptide repeat protein n=1 Tax=Pajaroellobacter abortibovis TaxID=1882918 RepID=UPI0009FAE0B6
MRRWGNCTSGKLPTPLNILVSSLHNNRGISQRHLTQYTNRYRCCSPRKEGEIQPSVATAYLNLGGLYLRTKHFLQAMECYKRALKTHLATVGPDHPFTEAACAGLRQSCTLASILCKG